MRTKRFSGFELICNLVFLFFTSIYTVYSLHFCYHTIVSYDIPTTMEIVKLWLFAIGVVTVLVFSTRLGCMLYFNTLMAEDIIATVDHTTELQVVLQLIHKNESVSYMTIFIPKTYDRTIGEFITENKILPASTKNYHIQWIG